MTTQNLTAVQGFGGDAGATVWWTLTGWTSRGVLRDAWVRQGLDEAALPELPTPEKRLGRAVQRVGELRRLARPVERRGHWAVVLESVEGEGVAARVTHTQSLTVRIVAGVPEYQHTGEQSLALSIAIRDEYAAREGLLHRDDVSLWLAKVIAGLHGTPLRPKGGLYYVLPSQVEQWRKVCNALEEAGAGSCYTLPTLKGEEATRAVLDALVRDVSDTAQDYSDKVHSGELGARALRARVKDCDALLERVAAYDDLLGGALDVLRQRVAQVQDAALAAAFAAEAPDEPAE
jgi:hypothetical protein